MARKLQSDLVLFGAVVVLVVFGLVMVFSASAVVAQQRYHFSYYFLLRQGIWAALGMAAMVLMMNFDYRRLANPRFIFPALGFQLALLLAVFLMPLRHNTHRWFYAGPLSFQPSELAKLLLVIFFAYFLNRQRGKVNDFHHTLLPLGLVTGVTVLLILREPDLGTSLAIVLIAATMLFAAGLRLRYFAMSAVAAVPMLYTVIFHVRYRLNRLLGFLHPQSDPLGKGFQMLQSLIAVGSGGILGAGLMEGRQKLFFLPEPQTDFIYAVISEELGFIGAVLVVVLFAIILWRGLRAAAYCPDGFGRLLAIGITVLLVGQALVNMSVVIGLLPTKGIPLPFVSYGGSSLLMNLIAAGVLLNISQRASGNALL
ncbi:MAG TPA: putative lipid II flippase FtsW [Terriglobia bacterium]|nr:putative lipid II flippase FtsW [Terriglobia bacterium]